MATKNNDGTYTLSEDELMDLIQNKKNAIEYLSDLYKLRDAILRVCQAFKITTPDGKHIRPTIINKTENPIRSLAKGGASYMTNMVGASAGIESCEKELEKNFGFLDMLGPMLTKYGGHGDKTIGSGYTNEVKHIGG
jgi:hypothetical protein